MWPKRVNWTKDGLQLLPEPEFSHGKEQSMQFSTLHDHAGNHHPGDQGTGHYLILLSKALTGSARVMDGITTAIRRTGWDTLGVDASETAKVGKILQLE